MAQSQHATSSFHKPLPYLSPGQIKEICEAAEVYIAEQRSRFWGRGIDLSRDQLSSLSAFFRADLLNSIRLFVLEDERVPNPPFYPMLRAMGFDNLPDFALMAAVTFQDVIVSNEPCSEGVLFHELVHAEQYRQLGLGRFAELYVRGFLSGGGYDGIPLEVNAYSLGTRFEDGRGAHFSVEGEVSSWIKRGAF
ncbi:MAG: hypothetical protein AUI12_17145 [Acidobacteria bacterium 13_2_20CM_2_57_6]|nr:MAG: hypothetical protein AUI12_17145 [Acidobacteria bacterium 13_2_20CM_2_57_6]PYT40181.1 MAG: hypothetical protein DMG47_19885 [Acidobacteriota bacterium]PYT42708.1 MAG: hypothetical protein DMG45_08930 [Acidobacteriota bacterium]